MFKAHTFPVRPNQAGFSLVEVLVTIIILSIGMLGSAGMQTAALQANTQTRYQVVAAALASELAESTHSDRYLPGNTLERYSDGVRQAEQTPVPLDVQKWTGIVGSFEANVGAPYTDSTGTTRKAFNIAQNSPYRPDLPNIATDPFVETGATGSFMMAGLALFANTQSFRADLPKARISTFSIDVNSYNMTGASASLRRGTQLHLAAKYGGFDDALAGNTGSPFAMGNNFAWQGANGDAKNYFVVSDPQKFLDSIGNVFASLVNETSSIAGSALTSQELSTSEANSVYQGGFNPVGGDWSGRVRKFALSLSADGKATLESTPAWDASELLTLRTLADSGASRNIVVGSPLGQQGSVGPSPFKWDSSLAAAHQDALNTSPSGPVDNLGPGRLNFLRGHRGDERSASAPQRPFRARTRVLGSVVNSGLVYQGAPSTTLAGTGYAAFQQTQKNRTPVVFANANDGMLHAFRASDGLELFAYIPGFIVPQLNILPDPDYTHRPLLDATPTVGEVQMNGQWRSVLVSGAGAGAQGIYALDVTEPDAFSKDSVLWEFTDADHAAMGNVLGKPRIVRVRMNDAGTGSDSYKWMAVVPTRVSGNFFNATQLARANAMRMSRHTLVQVVDADLGWVGGWRVYADMDRDMQYTAGTDTLIVEQGPAGDGVMSNGPSDDLEDRGTVADGYLLFNPAGFPRSSTDGIATGSVVFYLPEGRATAVVYSQAGRIRRCDPTKTGCRPTS